MWDNGIDWILMDEVIDDEAIEIIVFLIFALFINFSFAFGMTPAEEKKLFQDIAEIKATLKVFMEQTDKRFEDITYENRDI